MILTAKTAYDADLFGALLADAAAHDGQFMQRLQSGWLDGTKRFDRVGEVLIGAFIDTALVGVGSITYDPYAPSPELGRIRHFYVMTAVRRQGVGRAILRELVTHGRAHFSRLRLLTNNPVAALMYEAGGFQARALDGQTHELMFQTSSTSRP